MATPHATGVVERRAHATLQESKIPLPLSPLTFHRAPGSSTDATCKVSGSSDMHAIHPVKHSARAHRALLHSPTATGAGEFSLRHSGQSAGPDAMAARVLHSWAKGDRKYTDHLRVHPTGGLVAIDVLERENAATASAPRNSRKLSLRNSLGRKPLTLTVPSNSNKNAFDYPFSPASIILHDSNSISSPSSATKSGFSSAISNPSPSTIYTPESPLNKPLPRRPRSPSSPALSTVAELPTFTPSPTAPAILTPLKIQIAMGLAEYGRPVQMEGFDIQRPRTTTGVTPATRQHRRNRSENLKPMRDPRDPRDVSPTPLPLFARSRTVVHPAQGGSHDRVPVDSTRQPTTHLGSPLPVTKKRTASGSLPVQPPVPAKDAPHGANSRSNQGRKDRDIELEAIRIERDYYSHSLRETQTKIETALTQLSKSQVNERMLKAQIDALEGRLEDANSQRVDAFEQNMFLEEKLQHLLLKDNSGPLPRIERFTINTDTAKLRDAEQHIASLEKQLQATRQEGGLRSIVTALTGQIDQFQKSVKEKDTYIQALEQQNNNFRFHLENLQQRHHSTLKTNEALRAAQAAQKDLVEAQQASAAQLTHLETRSVELETQLHNVQAEKDQIAGLLHVEIRRQAAVVNNFEYPNASPLSQMSETERAIEEVKARVGSFMAKNGATSAHDPSKSTEERIADLEKEVAYHIKDIVLYKLDVKGYKKDLRRANAKVKKLIEAEATRQTLSPAGTAPSPSPSFASTATSSGPGSAYPTTPSPGPYNAITRSTFAITPEPLPRPEHQPTAPVIVPTISVRARTPTPKRTKRAVTPPPASSFQKFASSTPTTPTTPTAPQTVIPPPIARQRSMTGPVRSSSAGQTRPRGSSSVPPSPMWPHHSRQHSEPPLSMSGSSHEYVVEIGDRSPIVQNASSQTAMAPSNWHMVQQMHEHQRAKGVGEQQEYIQAQAHMQQTPQQQEQQRKGSATSRNSAQGWPDVPGGGLPPVQMWKDSNKKAVGA
ncbi:hypothetical protein NA57DRAFT_58227 [Rhizodiscina lignyota]|uniref:Uncharacterized protein n=1 Tax=Rhizodiscina lignyota TaxID=1504668 RepID=A0A9P4I797_9PEZI|nr:hypothetical protein NA57DRAFT_58227 [Rhizodiscina lignyota]